MALQRLYARLVSTDQNLVLSGTGQIVDGEVAAADDPILVARHVDSWRVGLWRAVTGGAWTRDPDFATNTQMVRGTEFFVAEGSEANAGSEWYFGPANPSPVGIVVGSTPLYVERRSYPFPVTGSGGIQSENGVLYLPTRSGLQGQYPGFEQVEVTEQGLVVEARASSAVEAYIEGLEVRRTGPMSIEVGEGRAFVPSFSLVVAVDEPLLKSGLTLTPSAVNYLYLWNNAGVVDIEVSTTGPAEPYYARARVKGPTGGEDDTRRYIGHLVVNSFSQITSVYSVGNRLGFFAQNDGPLLLNSATVASMQPGTPSSDLRGLGGIPLDAWAVHVWLQALQQSATRTLFVASADYTGSSGGNLPRLRGDPTTAHAGAFWVPLGTSGANAGKIRFMANNDENLTGVSAAVVGWAT